VPTLSFTPAGGTVGLFVSSGSHVAARAFPSPWADLVGLADHLRHGFWGASPRWLGVLVGGWLAWFPTVLTIAFLRKVESYPQVSRWYRLMHIRSR
jgi:hypothetical protein